MVAKMAPTSTFAEIRKLGTSWHALCSGGSRGDPGVRANPPLDPC